MAPNAAAASAAAGQTMGRREDKTADAARGGDSLAGDAKREKCQMREVQSLFCSSLNDLHLVPSVG